MELRSGARKAGELSLWMSIVGAELDMDWSLLIDGVRCFLSRNDNIENLLLCFGGIPRSSGDKGASVTILSPGWSNSHNPVKPSPMQWCNAFPAAKAPTRHSRPTGWVPMCQW